MVPSTGLQKSCMFWSRFWRVLLCIVSTSLTSFLKHFLCLQMVVLYVYQWVYLECFFYQQYWLACWPLCLSHPSGVTVWLCDHVMNWFGHKNYLTTPLLPPGLIFKQTQFTKQLYKLVYRHKQEVGGRWEWKWYWCRKTVVWNSKTQWDLDLSPYHLSYSPFFAYPTTVNLSRGRLYRKFWEIIFPYYFTMKVLEWVCE